MKILFQIQGPGTANYTGVWSSLAKMWKEEGWRGFMRGNGTNCIRIVPYSACQFAAYTTYKRVNLRMRRGLMVVIDANGSYGVDYSITADGGSYGGDYERYNDVSS